MSLTEAYAALRRGEAETCLTLLGAVTDPDPRAVARVHAYRAQALRHLGRADEAERAIADAIRAAKAAGDLEGVTALRELQSSILASVVSTTLARKQMIEDRQLLSRPDETLTDDERLRKSAVLLEDGDRSGAAAVLAGMEGQDPRSGVLKLLALARCGDATTHIRAAHRIADAADDQGLLTAVAQAARAANVTLEAPSFG